MLRYTCIACLVLMLLWFWNLHSNSLSACTTTRGREFTISANLGFGQQTTELTELPRMYPAWNVVGGGRLAAACPIVNIEVRTRKSRGVERRGTSSWYDWRIARLQPLAATRVGSVSVSSRWEKQLSVLLCTAFVTWFGGGSGGGKLYIKSTVCRLGVESCCSPVRKWCVARVRKGC